MHPQHVRKSFLVAGGLLALLVAAALSQATMDDVEVVPEEIAEGVYCLTGRGGNVGVSIGSDGVLMVDDQFAPLAPKLQAAIDSLSGGAPAFLINTHHHGDHTGGNATFGRSATIVAHANVRGRLAAGGAEAPALPVVTHEDGLSIHFNGEEVRILHVPEAHTDGDSVVWFTGKNVVHMGDLYFQVGYPYVDLDGGGSIQGLIAGVEGLLERIPADARIIPGHGEPGGVEGLREYLKMLREVTERVRAGLANGDDADAMIESGITSDYDERWGGFAFVPPGRFIRAVAASLSRAGGR